MARKLIVFCFLLVMSRGLARASNIYIAQNATGSANGSSCAAAYPYTFFNNAGNWGTTAGKIGPGTTVHLCGVISSFLTFHGSGVNGSPITLLWEQNAKISVPSCGTSACINFANRSYLVFDGGTNGVLEATANGTLLPYNDPGTGLLGRPCNYCEFRNLTIRNLYVHTSIADNNGGGNGIVTGGPGVLFHDMTCHDVHWCFVYAGGYANDSIDMWNLTAYRTDHCFVIGYNGAGLRLTSGKVRNSECYDPYNWDTTSNVFHHDGIHAYFLNGATANSLEFYNNYIHGNWGANSTANVYIQGFVPSFIFNNLFTDVNGQGTYRVWINGSTCYIFNNTFQTAKTKLDHVYVNGCANTTFANNIVVNGSQALWFSSGGGPFAFAQNGLHGNVYWGVQGVSPGAWRLDNVIWTADFPTWKKAVYSAYRASGADVSSNTNDPKLDANWMPQSGSSAVSIGNNFTGTVPAAAQFDRAGKPRPATGAWDAGAYNHLTTASLPASPTALTATVR